MNIRVNSFIFVIIFMASQIFLWHGENDYEIREKVNAWTVLFEKKHTGLNIIVLDAKSISSDTLFSELKNALQVDSLFGANKLIILKNFLIAKSKLPDEIKDLIINSFEKLSPTFFIVFTQSEALEKVGRLYKKIAVLQKERKAETKEFALPKGSGLNRWVAGRAKKAGASFSPDAASALIGLVGGDLWQLDAEIEKLANYKKGGAIKTEDVNLLVKGKYNEDIFQLMDAISAKDKKTALKLFNDQMESGAAELYLFTMLVRQFRLLWQVKECVKDNNADPDQISRAIGMHPFVARKTLQYSGRFTVDQIQKIYRELLEMEITMKTKSVGFEVLFDSFISRI